MNEMLDDRVAHSERVAGFVDVLGTCAQWPLIDEPLNGDGLFRDRRRLPLPAGPITIEMAQVACGASGQSRLSGDEFVLVLEGDVTFEQSGAQCALGAGEAGVVVRDRPLEWRSDGGAKLIVMRCTGGGVAGSDGPVRIDQRAPLAPSNPPAPDVLIGPTPQCRNHSDYRSATGEFACGIWDSTPYTRRLVVFRHYELMRLLEGSVTFVDAAGREGTFGEGDVILFEQGGGAAWESREYVKKIYSTYRPAE
jgi:uncharacterized cupin superfamily protein